MIIVSLLGSNIFCYYANELFYVCLNRAIKSLELTKLSLPS